MSFISKLLKRSRTPAIAPATEDVLSVKRARIAALLREIAEPMASRG